jgi:hypothetical protein
MPEKPLVDQLYHKLIPDTITASIYTDVMKLIAGSKFDVEGTKRAMQEALYIWQVLDDLVDIDQDASANVANIVLMCLQHTNERLPHASVWPEADQIAHLLPQTARLLRQVFRLLTQWIRSNRPDVSEFLFTEFGRVYPNEWNNVLKKSPNSA